MSDREFYSRHRRIRFNPKFQLQRRTFRRQLLQKIRFYQEWAE